MGEQVERGLEPLCEKGGAACPASQRALCQQVGLRSQKMDTDTWTEGHGMKTTGIGREFFIGDHISASRVRASRDIFGKQVHISLLLDSHTLLIQDNPFLFLSSQTKSKVEVGEIL